MESNILIVDDELTQCKILTKFIEGLGHNPLVITSGIETVDYIMNDKVFDDIPAHDVDVLLLDLSMPDLDGLEVLRQIKETRGDLQIIVLTANKDISLAIKAINYGAIDYVVKGEKDVFSRVSASIKNALEKRNLKYQVSKLERQGKDQVSFSDILGTSEEILSVVQMAKKAVNLTIPVLISGKSGVGKELFAKAIHGSSLKSGKPFVTVECDTLKNRNCDRILLGSDRVLEDGSIEKDLGKIREANGGTLFLKRIDTLKPDAQMRILRFLQDGEVTPLGSKYPVKVTVRVIASTMEDLDKMVKSGEFRGDLYYKLSSYKISVPSLNERGEGDIKILSEEFCNSFAITENKKIKTIPYDTMYLLCNYEWEDNVRQLRNSIFRAVVLCDESILKPKYFPRLFYKKADIVSKAKARIKKSSDLNSELIDIFDDNGNCKNLSTLEEEIVKRLVEVYGGNLSEVAKRLEVGRSTIYRKLKIAESEEDNK